MKAVHDWYPRKNVCRNIDEKFEKARRIRLKAAKNGDFSPKLYKKRKIVYNLPAIRNDSCVPLCHGLSNKPVNPSYY